MKKSINEMFSPEIVRRIKMDENYYNNNCPTIAKGVNLVKLIEMGLVEIVGQNEKGLLIYQMKSEDT